MKRVLLTVALMLCLVGASFGADANEPDKSMTFWLSANSPAYQNTDLSVMLGFRQGNTELGVATEWRMYAEGDTETQDQSDFAIGPYAVVHLPGVIQIKNPLPIDWLPAELAGDPFVGLAYVFDVKGKGATFAPFTGLRVFDLFAFTVKYSMYSPEIPADNQLQLGLSGQWAF